MMGPTDYVVRSWKVTTAGHAHATVVDRYGRVIGVTIHRAAAPNHDIDGLIRDRIAAMPAHRLHTR